MLIPGLSIVEAREWKQGSEFCRKADIGSQLSILSKGSIQNASRPARKPWKRVVISAQITKSSQSPTLVIVLDRELIMTRAFGRIGSAYNKLNDLENAVKFYSKSLTEHRTPDILTKLRETEKAKAEADRKSYIDPQKAESAREEGNTAFKVCLVAIILPADSLDRQGILRLP